MERLLKDEIKSRFATNIVQSRKFSELLVDSLAKYRNRAIETAQVIEELIAMAKQFNEAARRGEEVNLNDAELAFYDALETNEASVRKLGDEILVSFLESSLAFDSNSQASPSILIAKPDSRRDTQDWVGVAYCGYAAHDTSFWTGRMITHPTFLQ